ncbi:hypothetical protein B0H19DRAFT_1188706 [Mycena capillaripes]|nr:hypothetical protein B0H19DRAFT_1188706 [Mycena capillaripes]
MLRLSTRKIIPASFPTRPLSTLVRSQTSRPFRNLQYIAGSPILQTSSRGSPVSVPGTSAFHSTPSRKGAPLIPLLAILKTSAAMEIVRTAGRIVLTVIPVILIKNHKTRRHLKHAAIHGVPISEERTSTLLKRIRNRTLLFHALFFIPGILFWSTIFASLERTPLTGRWRLIILSPEEEDDIAAQLAGPGWYQAVGEILSQDGPPQLIPPSDWRYGWVRDTLRELERTIPVLINEGETCQDWSFGGRDDIPLPPPAEYPLRPRPRATEYLRMFCESMCKRHVSPVPHSIPGPPYSLLVVDKPDASNAFSYGFGPDGGGGIVVYSGFLDEILARAPPECEIAAVAPAPAPASSWWSILVGGIFSPTPPSPTHPVPTASQTAELAILLSHELAHLVLSHHLETLSSATIIIPGVMSMVSDIIRVIIFPVTMLFGPFVNDAVAQLGKVGSGELEKVGEYCTSVKQEIEADVVSARLLAHAGYDARKAVTFWENRSNSPGECSSAERKEIPSSYFVHNITGSKHPVSEVRVNSLKEELLRWETERRAELRRREIPREESDIVLATA